MKRCNLKPLTETSWIMSSNGERFGLVVQGTSGQVVLLSDTDAREFTNLAEMGKALSLELTIEETVDLQPEKEQGFVDGFPVKHDQWFNISNDPFPSYTRSEKSKNRYAAGYFGLKFPHGWTQSFCPKISTLSEYEYIGPFTTKLEMKHQISSKNKTVNA